MRTTSPTSINHPDFNVQGTLSGRAYAHECYPRLDYKDTRPYTESVFQAFQRGRIMLDAKCPKWFLLINLHTFDFANPTKCILAQVFGGYCDGQRALGLKPREDFECGFDAPCDETDELEELWTVEIHRKRHSPGGPYPPTLAEDACAK